MDGQPFFYVNKETDPGLIATLRQDLVPFLDSHVPLTPALQQRLEAHARQHRFTLVLDREGYSPEWFAELQAQRIGVLTYHKYPGEDWPREEFVPARCASATGHDGGRSGVLLRAASSERRSWTSDRN